jgi:hypothetical protein
MNLRMLKRKPQRGLRGVTFGSAPAVEETEAVEPPPDKKPVRGLRRSAMSAKEKADYIARHGRERYFALPY